MIPDDIIEQILDKTSLSNLIGDGLKKKGRYRVMCCPFHEEKTPSFKVDEQRGTFRCYGCGKSGNAITWVMEDKGLSFPGAVKWLANYNNIEYEDKPESEEEKEKRQKKEALKSLMERVAAFYVELFNASKQAQQYAYRRWGEEFCREFGLGYAPDSGHALVDWARQQGENLENLKALDLIRAREDGSLYDFFRSRVMIPIKDRIGYTLSFTARDLTGNKESPK